MDKGVLLANFDSECNLPKEQCYTHDPFLSSYGLVNNGCAEPTNELKKKLNISEDISFYGGLGFYKENRLKGIKAICLCVGDFCNSGRHVFLSGEVLLLSTIYLITTMTYLFDYLLI